MSRMITLDISKVLDKYDGERQRARDAADQLVAKVATEDREFTKDEEVELKAHQDNIVSLTKRCDLLKKQAELGASLDKPGESRTQRGTIKPNDDGDEDEETPEQRERKREAKRYSKTYKRWLRVGMNRLGQDDQDVMHMGQRSLPADDPEVRALSALTGQTGGFTVPAATFTEIERAMKSFAAVLQTKARVLDTETGADIPWPTVNDTSNEGEQVDENTATTEDSPSIFGQIMVKSYLFSTKIIYLPIQLIQDSGVNIEGLLTEMMAERLGRILNRRWTLGNNANQPQGVVPASVLGKTAASGTAVTYGELVDLQISIDPAYWEGCEWQFNTSTFGALRKLLDSQGRPIWMPAMNAGMAGGAPGLLLDKPYSINTFMASMASGNRSIVYGAFRKYLIRRVKNMVMVRLTERAAEKFQVGFVGFIRADGKLLDAGTNPIKHLVHP
ncbi:MAG: phage major capsid protein [Phycisphaerales bacterium]